MVITSRLAIKILLICLPVGILGRLLNILVTSFNHGKMPSVNIVYEYGKWTPITNAKLRFLSDILPMWTGDGYASVGDYLMFIGMILSGICAGYLLTLVIRELVKDRVLKYGGKEATQ